MAKKLRIVCIVLLFIALFMLTINIIPPKKVMKDNPFVVGEGNLPMIAAHRGGAINNPENTLLAFREAVNSYGAQIIESDLYLTKDGYLVYNHDGYIDETCDINGDIPHPDVIKKCKIKSNRHYIKDMTLDELKKYNFGYYFSNSDGRIYKDVTNIEEQGLQIATVEQLFEEFYESNPELLFIVEIKDSGDMGRQALKKLDETLKYYPDYADNVVVGSFHREIEKELEENYPHLMRGASVSGAAGFILTQFLGVNLLYPGKFSCLQIPLSYDLKIIELRLDFKTIINRAHRKNMAVQYWTVNDEDEMRHLIELGVDCIMTDNPALLRQVLNEYEGK